MELHCAGPEEFDRVAAFYRRVCADTPDMARYGRWIYGKHPTDAMLKDYLKQGALYLLEEGDRIAAAMALTPFQGESYRDLAWSQNLADDEAAVVHILCVSPAYRGRGLGRRMAEESLALARAAGKQAVRLDALADNPPAHRVYLDCGFRPVGKKHLYFSNTGWADFVFFEHPL